VKSRPQLSEEEEGQERDERARLHAIDAKLEQLHRQRSTLLDEVHRLSDEQRKLFDQRQPKHDLLERLDKEHRELGHRISEFRKQRDHARQEVAERIADARMARPAAPRSEAPLRPEQIRREIARLEHKQQTSALPLSEENELVDQMRALSKLLTRADAIEGARSKELTERKALEEKIHAARAAVDLAGREMEATKHARDGKMAEMRRVLEEAGAILAAIRDKAHERGVRMEKIREIGAEIGALEREGDKILRDSRSRRFEAKRTIQRYTPGAMRARQEAAVADAADAQLEELMKRGKVTLGG
jgi:uncharacterized coiled-coil DUF342 family protein